MHLIGIYSFGRNNRQVIFNQGLNPKLLSYTSREPTNVHEMSQFQDMTYEIINKKEKTYCTSVLSTRFPSIVVPKTYRTSVRPYHM